MSVDLASLDPGIARVVYLLRANGVETYESCQGGPDHNGGAGDWPVVRFHGGHHEGFRALSVAMMYDLPVYALHRVWRLEDDAPTGPQWELVFHPDKLAAYLTAQVIQREEVTDGNDQG